MQAVSDYCLALVQHIEEKQGYPLPPRVRKAFLSIPRHAFLSAYYENQVLHSVPPPDQLADYEQWLNCVYEDKALTTRQDAQGVPLSSSSQPSIMARMLQYLDIQPGQRVLEIGTGTGYNAALLGYLAADPAYVTTIDIDPQLIALAQTRVESVIGSGETLVTGNGLQGYLPNAPYDRILATGSTFPVPLAWISQLASGGKLVLDLRGHLFGGLMLITKQAENHASGIFLPVQERVSFMALRETADGPVRARSFDLSLLEEEMYFSPESVEYACAQHFWSYEQFRDPVNDAFNLWLQCLFPRLSLKWKQRRRNISAIITESNARTMLVIEKQAQHMHVATSGNHSLWLEILQAYQEWLALGKPGRDCSSLLITPDGQFMRIVHQNKSRMFPLSS